MTPALELSACVATTWQATPDMALRSVVVTGLLGLGAWASAQRAFLGQRAFIGLTLLMAAWTAFSVAEHAAVAPDCKATLGLLAWAPILAQPAMWVLFLYRNLHGDALPLRRRTIALLAAPGLLLLAMAWSNGRHGLFYGPDTALGPPIAGLPRLRYAYGPMFYAAVALNYTWIAAALLLALKGLRLAPPRQRGQWRLFVLVMLIPMVVNLAYLGLGIRLLGVDPTSTGFAAAALGFAWLIHRHHLVTVVPVARQLLFQELPDPVLVLDHEGRVVEANRAARRLVDAEPPMDLPLAAWPRLGDPLQRFLASGEEGPMALADPPAWFEVLHRPLGDPQQRLGALVQLHDVSTRHRAHAEAVRTLAARQLELDKATALQSLLREQAMHDPLTGLLNRRALDERFGHERRDTTEPLTLVLLDLDHFKQVNDRHGHATGDAVLRDFGAAVRSGLRATDALFRVGGEEFALLMPGVVPEVAMLRVNTLRQLVGRWRLGGLAEPQTFSAGLGLAGPGESLAALTARVDAALYRAKAAGRNRSELALEPAPD
jgi:diguanylate cyclase (GGDEF)-like protein